MRNEKLFIALFFVFWLLLIVSGCSSKPEGCAIQPLKYIGTFSSSRNFPTAGATQKMPLSTLVWIVDGIKGGEKDLVLFPMLMDGIKEMYDQTDWSKSDVSAIVEASRGIAKIFGKDSLKLSYSEDQKMICDCLVKLANEFYQVCESDSTLPKMIYTWDSGPYWGLDTEMELPAKSTLHLDNIQAKLLIREANRKSTLELIDRNGILKWRKFLTEGDENYIWDVNFAGHPIRDSSDLGFRIGMYGQGEFLDLFLRPDGDFRFYYHSW
jgi:hypothetical protein